jgi:tetratricopeptide (TPR) repeat protein
MLPYRLDVVVELTGRDGRRVRRLLRLRDVRTEFRWPVDFDVAAIEIDPDFEILHWNDAWRAEATALAPAMRATLMRLEGKLDDARHGLESALRAVPSPDIYGARFALEFALARVYLNERNWREARAHLDAALASPTRRAEDLPWAYFRLATLAQAIDDRALLHRAVGDVESADAAAGGESGATAAARALEAVTAH